MGLIHKSAAGTELSTLSLRPTHTQSGERVLIQGVKLKTKREVLMMLVDVLTVKVSPPYSMSIYS